MQNARRGRSEAVQLTVSGPKPALVGVLLQPGATAKLRQSGAVTLDGDAAVLDEFLALLDEFDIDFPIVLPQPTGTGE